MGSRLKIAISMRLASGIYLIVAIGVLLSVADANPGAKPLTVKAHVGVDVNSGESQSSGNTNNRCGRQNEGCFKKGETGCNYDCSSPCCEGLKCDDSSDSGICISKVDVNSGESQSSGNTNNRCARQNEGFCFKKGETDCKAPCSGPCCEGLRCDDSSNWRGICISK